MFRLIRLTLRAGVSSVRRCRGLLTAGRFPHAGEMEFIHLLGLIVNVAIMVRCKTLGKSFLQESWP